MFLKLLVVIYAATSLSALPASTAGGSAYKLPAHSITAKQSRLPLHQGASPVSGPSTSVAPRLSAGPKISLLGGLNKPGLKATDNSNLNLGAPPDTTGAIGPGYYIEMVNSIIAIYHRADLSFLKSSSFQTWLGKSPGTALCDPQIQWDSSSQRWLYVVLGCSFSLHYFLFGWSKSSDPTDFVNGWCKFSAPTPGELTDYPKLGHSGSYMIVGTNDFANQTTFDTAQIFWMATPAPGDSSCTQPAINSAGSKATPLRNDDSSLSATPVPVNTMTGAADGYVLAAYDPSGPPTSVQDHIAIWHVDAAGALQKDADIAVTAYTVPNPAPNAGGSFPIDTLDGRLTQAVGDPLLGMWTQHTVSPSVGPAVRSQVNWYEVQVAAGVPALTQEGAIASSTDFVFNGAISPTFDSHGVAIQYNRSSSSLLPLIAAQSRTTLTPLGQMDPVEMILATSADFDQDFTCGFMGFPCRWGDYAGASPDPIAPSVVWGANQTLALHDSANPSFPVWVTRIFAMVVQSRQVTPVPGSGPGSRPPVQQVSPAPSPPPR